MNDDKNICHRKVLLKDLRSASLSAVWVNGKIEQTVGTDILIINDGTGRAKISKCDSVHSATNKSWICKGAHCCIIGFLTNAKGLPEIVAKKIVNISDNELAIKSWNLEVRDTELYLNGKHQPELMQEDDIISI